MDTEICLWNFNPYQWLLAGISRDKVEGSGMISKSGKEETHIMLLVSVLVHELPTCESLRLSRIISFQMHNILSFFFLYGKDRSKRKNLQNVDSAGNSCISQRGNDVRWQTKKEKKKRLKLKS